MLRFARTTLALLALGLWASLIPQVTYPSSSSGDPSGNALIAWPGWGVQQDLGSLSGTVDKFHIWISAEPDRGVITVFASVVDASTNEVLRQTTLEATPAYVPVLRTLTFPSYGIPQGQRLALQLRVADFETRYVILGLAHAHSEYANVSLNDVADYATGPLAFAHVRTGNGLRAAILGEVSGRIRLVMAIGLIALAVALHPSVLARIRRALVVVAESVRTSAKRIGSVARIPGALEAGTSESSFGRFISVPWYPWFLAVAPILHFSVTNNLHFSARDAIVPIGLVLVVVTGSVGSLWIVFREWHRPAAATAAATALFFGYGHIELALAGWIDERALFAVTVVLGIVLVLKIASSESTVSNWAGLLNIATSSLVVFSLSMLLRATISVGDISPSKLVEPSEAIAHLGDVVAPMPGKSSPDIYYIILDSYGRHDEIGSFDNSGFLKALEDRECYVATEATSNYEYSIQSITSSLNMSYLHGLGNRSPQTEASLVNASRFNALASVLKSLGYTYVHLESGTLVSDSAPLADLNVSFTPSGAIANVNEVDRDHDLVSRDYVRALVSTTALGPLLGDRFLLAYNAPLIWFDPIRTLQMFQFLRESIEADSPKFVFAHIMKPHRPATFDRYGNYVSGRTLDVSGVKTYDEFHDQHDPTVPDAYIGQLIYINSLVLDAIDSIVSSSGERPIIVLAGDHGRGEGYSRHAIFAAFCLPGEGAEGLYASISSVNHFRYILDYYFNLELGLLEDVEMQHDQYRFNFGSAAPIGSV